MEELCAEGLATHGGPSHASMTREGVATRWQGHVQAGYRAAKWRIRGAHAVQWAEGNIADSAIASCQRAVALCATLPSHPWDLPGASFREA